MQGENFQIDKEPIEMIHLPNQDVPQNAISQLVSEIIDRKNTDPNYDVTSIEATIDKYVYLLYELTPEEIMIIESNC